MNPKIPSFAVLLGLLACASDPGGPEGPTPGGVDFGLPAGTFGAHHAEGSPATAGPVLDGAFAIALPDSLGGLAILSHSPGDGGRSDLFVLQLNTIATGEFACASVTLPGTPCHGRLLIDVPVDGSGRPAGIIEIASGTLVLTNAGPDRVQGTLRAVLAPYDDPDGEPRIVIENGTIDVPLVRDTFTSGAIACLRAYTGGQPLPAGCR